MMASRRRNRARAFAARVRLPANAVALIARPLEIEAGIDDTHARTLIEQSTKLME